MANKAQHFIRSLGPWPDGVITRHEGSYDVAETFLHDCINLDITDYGVLVQRNGFARFHDSWTDGWPANFTNHGLFRLLGSHPSDQIAGNLRLYVSLLINVGGTWRERIYYTDDPTTGSPTQLIENNHGAGKPADNVLWSQSVLYGNKVYFIRRNIAAAGAFPNNVKMTNGDTTGATAASIAAGNGKYGYYAFVMQDRLFVADMNGNTVNYSKATDFENFTAPDGGFFNVNPGDAQTINAVVNLEDIVFFFKEDTTWAFTFNTDPAVDGILRVVSRTYGAFDATTQGSDIYVVNRNGVFRFIDGNFIDIAVNLKGLVDVPDAWDSDSSITVVGNKLIVGSILPTGGTFTGLCMNLTTGAWTKYLPVDPVIGPTSKRSYQVSESGGKTFMVWGDTPSAVGDVATSTGGYFTMMRVGGDIADIDNRTRDQDKAGLTYVPRFLLITVPTALDDPHHWKKLYRWRYDIEHEDFDNEDAFPVFSVREGDPNTVDTPSETATTYKDYYTDFFDAALTSQRRFRVIQFGIDKAAHTTDVQAGPGIDQKSTFRVRGLSIEYSVKGPFRN